MRALAGILTALLAAAPALADEPAVADEESGAEADTAELESDLESRIAVYGFADFSYARSFIDSSSGYAFLVDPYASFAVGSLNLYLDASISSRWRSLAEVRFLYLPHGTENVFDFSDVERASTEVSDYSDFQRPIRWGGIEIERAWLEFNAYDWLTIRAGQWLTPYGIWNVDHGSPTIISIRRPYVVGEQLLPERQTGLELYGRTYLSWFDVGYHLTISNGRGPVDSYRDLDHNLALGGHVFAEGRPLGQLAVGLSAYAGKFTDRGRIIRAQVIADTLAVRVLQPVTEQYDERSFGIDVKWEWDALLVYAEAIRNERAYTDAGRPRNDPPRSSSTFTPDGSRYGAYVIVGYRTPWLGIMPYALVEGYHFGNFGLGPDVWIINTGLNARVHPAVVIKAEFGHGFFPDATPGSLFEHPLNVLQGQIAWAF